MATTTDPLGPGSASRGQVLWHFTMSLDGFVSGPRGSMDWLTGHSRPDVLERYAAATGAVLAGRRGWDLFGDVSYIYGPAWQGPVFVLTHRLDAEPAEGVTFLNCDVAEAVRTGLAAAAGRNLEILSPSIGRQALERGLVDHIDLHVAPVLLGDGTRLFENRRGLPIRLEAVLGADASGLVDLRYRPLGAAPDTARTAIAEHARAALESERAEADRRLDSLTADFAGVVEASRDSNADDEHDPEGATIAFERSQVGSLIAQARRRRAELDAALARLETGTYGVCEECGRPIGTGRLAARPAARTCIRCALGS